MEDLLSKVSRYLVYDMDKDKGKRPTERDLKQLLYTHTVYGKYTCGPVEMDNLGRSEQLLKDCLTHSQIETLLGCVEKASEDRLLPKRGHLFQTLAHAISLPDMTAELKNKIGATVLKIIKSDDELFEFVYHATVVRKTMKVSKLSKAIRKIVARYYGGKSPEELVRWYISYSSLHGWTHKDLIKFCHIGSDTALKNVVINYILTKKPKEPECEEGKRLLELLKKADTLRSTKDLDVALDLIKELEVKSFDNIDPSLRKTREVWDNAITHMHLSDVLKALPKLYKRGFLKKDSSTYSRVNANLTNVHRIKASGLHPIEVFIHMKNFEKGGRPLDPKLIHHLKNDKDISETELAKIMKPLEVKSPTIMANLLKCMNQACVNNVQPIGKRYLITVDTTDKMETPCLGNKNIPGVEVAAAFVWYLLRVEKDVTVAIFKEKEIAVLKLDKKGAWHEHLQILRENKSEYLVLASPIEWATSHKKHYDIFINFIQHREYYASVPKDIRDKMMSLSEALQKYKRKVNLPNAKLITLCMSSNQMSTSRDHVNMLDIAGLDAGTPRVIEAFCRGSFS